MGSFMSRRQALALLAAAPLATRAVQTPAPTRGRRVIPKSASAYLLDSDGTVKAWSLLTPFGGNLGLGHGDRVPQYTAFQIPGLRNIEAVAAASNAGYALLADGTLVAWGSNARGELGNTPLSEVEALARSRDASNSPTPVINVTNAVDVAAGDYHALALTRAGTVFVWGYNLDGQLGIDMPVINFKTHTPAPMIYLPFPVKMPDLADVAAVSGGTDHSLALLKDGTVRAWGNNKAGQLGDGTVVNRPRPVPVVGVRNATAIAAGSQLSAAVLSDGTVMTWGSGNSALGRRALKRDIPHSTPAVVEGVTGVRKIAIGANHMLGLTQAGTVISWGDSRVGEVGHPGAEPKRIDGLTKVASIAADTSASFAVLANGTIMVWGSVPWWAGVDGDEHDVAKWPIPLVIKNLNNPVG